MKACLLPPPPNQNNLIIFYLCFSCYSGFSGRHVGNLGESNCWCVQEKDEGYVTINSGGYSVQYNCAEEYDDFKHCLLHGDKRWDWVEFEGEFYLVKCFILIYDLCVVPVYMVSVYLYYHVFYAIVYCYILILILYYCDTAVLYIFIRGNKVRCVIKNEFYV